MISLKSEKTEVVRWAVRVLDGDKEYQIDKKRIKPPWVPVRLSEKPKKERAKRLVVAK